MKKIKRFKINIRTREVLRLLKNTTKIVPDARIEDLVRQESVRVQKCISPAALYETHPADKIPQELIINPPSNWVAASLFIITIGAAMETEIAEAPDEEKGAVLHAIALEGLEQSCNFVHRLIIEEGKDESCEVTRDMPLTALAAEEKVFSLMPPDKIGVRLTGENMFEPRYSLCALSYWSPVKKRK